MNDLRVSAGQTVWCRTAYDTWWKTTAAGPVTYVGRPGYRAVPVLGWYRDHPDWPVNWSAEDVRTTAPEEPA